MKKKNLKIILNLLRKKIIKNKIDNFAYNFAAVFSFLNVK